MMTLYAGSLLADATEPTPRILSVPGTAVMAFSRNHAFP